MSDAVHKCTSFAAVCRFLYPSIGESASAVISYETYSRVQTGYDPSDLITFRELFSTQAYVFVRVLGVRACKGRCVI